MTLPARVAEAVYGVRTADVTGSVVRSIGLMLESSGPPARVGEKCLVFAQKDAEPIPCEVIGFNRQNLLLMPFDDVQHVRVGSLVKATGGEMVVPVGDDLLGRIVDGLGAPLDDRGPVRTVTEYPVDGDPPAALSRPGINRVLPLGVRAMDGLLTCGVGQRIGIFAGPGVGKSTLLGMMARNARADVNVIALIGERGREVGEFIQRDLGEDGLARSVVVVATGDKPPVMVMRAAQVATSIAEYFRDTGRDVLLMMDSITRFAWAQREIGLAVGEPPTRGGYTPSVFAALPRLLERGGNSRHGSITALCTVLVDGNDMDEPVASAARATLDGHIVLSPELAARGHYPAIDVLESVSRVMPQICTPEHLHSAREVRANVAAYREASDIIELGAYVRGSDHRIDRALILKDAIDIFLRQTGDELTPFEDTVLALAEICSVPSPQPEHALARGLQDAYGQAAHGPTSRTEPIDA